MTAAQRLDAADGVMDGKFFGRGIVGGGYGGGVAGYGGAVSGYGGFRAPVAGTTFGAGFASPAAQLDAADGVMDGRHFGSAIVGGGYGAGVGSGFASTTGLGMGAVSPLTPAAGWGGGYSTGYGGFLGGGLGTSLPATTFGGGSAAARLDAADGVMDGKFFGRGIVGGGYGSGLGTTAGLGGVSSFPTAGYGGAALSTGYGGFSGATSSALVPFAGGASAAARLDAADGVMDGKFFGAGIVGGGYGSGFSSYGASSYGAASPLSSVGMGVGAFGSSALPPAGFSSFGSGFGGVPAYGGYGGVPAYGGYSGSFGAVSPVRGAGYAGSPFAGSQAAAARLDAADGVMDGRFFGSQVVA